MAFLINAYNAFTVEKILTRCPELGSIRHETLRKRYREPRDSTPEGATGR